LAVVALVVLIGAAAKGGYIHFGGGGGPAQPPKSFEANLDGKIFGVGKVGEHSVVFMGEDVGLLQVSSTKDQTAEQRAKTVATRLNVSYATACPSCGGTGLEPNDIKVGRYLETGDTVVFYAHMHGYDEVEWGPELLATVNEDQAKALSTTPKYLAAYWRDLIRDTVALSRGFPVENSALGEELAGAFAKARGELSGEDSSVANLRRILNQTTSKQALKLREIFAQVPERKPAKDDFGGVEGYEPLRD
jgi:hypothetical protein